jgi:hypothetical protein
LLAAAATAEAAVWPDAFAVVAHARAARRSLAAVLAAGGAGRAAGASARACRPEAALAGPVVAVRVAIRTDAVVAVLAEAAVVAGALAHLGYRVAEAVLRCSGCR